MSSSSLLIRKAPVRRLFATQAKAAVAAAAKPSAAAAAAASTAKTASSRALLEATGKTDNLHRSNAEALVNKVPVILVQGSTAICEGGGGALGHPVEYIQLETRRGTPSTCKYCGLRYAKDPHYHGGGH
jgi:NADH dehydrogenase (ubiquinone) Fe-S protein 6